METVTDVVIHVGFRKTATSWLQEILFPNLDLNYIGKTDRYYPKWLIEWHYADDFYFDKKKDHIRNQLLSNLCKDRCNLLSSEAFTNTASVYSQAYRIHEVWPNARILVTLRDPVEMVWSHYRNDIQKGDCFVDIEDWLDWERTPYVLNKRKAIYLPDFFFDEAIGLYEKLFGAQNVCVLLFEDMHFDPKRYFGFLFRFLGIDADIPSHDLLAHRVNESPKEIISLEHLKLLNLKRYLSNHFPDYTLILSKNLQQIEQALKEKADESELRNRLAEYFRGRSYGYY